LDCKHLAPLQESSTIVDLYEDRLTFEFNDGPLAGSAACRTCGQLFLFLQDNDGDGKTEWSYFPISKDVEKNLENGEVNAFRLADSLKNSPHMHVTEYWHGVKPARAKWLSR
jgi:hypothetical protein